MTSESAARLESQYGSFVARRIGIIAILAVCVFVVTGIALSINALDIGFFESYRYLFDHLTGKEYPFDSREWNNDYVMWNVYAPRIFMGIVAGAGLALSGVVMQSLMNNPLADPYTTGISDGACFGAVASIVLGMSFATVMRSLGIVVNAFICGLVPAAIIIILSRIVRLSPATAILVGIALSYIFSGFETVIMVGTDADTLQEAYLWRIGSLSGMTWKGCLIPLAVTAVSSAIMIPMSRNLNLLALGDDSAASLGLDVDRFRTVCMMLVSVTIACIVSFCGIIGFVGLIAPHIVRMCIGGDNRFLIPASMLTGMVFIEVADIISRVVISPDELRVGIVAAMVGAPFFLYVILRRKKGYGEDFRWREVQVWRADISAPSGGNALR